MLKVNEIYKSIQGESSYAGLPCVFIRLAGCHLRCSYCDSTHAYHEGEALSIEEVAETVRWMTVGMVEITGGEPLLQKDAYRLAQELADAYRIVLVETSGTVDLADLDPRVIKIMDIKCPGSGMSDKMHWENIALLNDRDEIKFVIGDRQDFDWASGVVREMNLRNVLFSPVYDKLKPSDLADWVLSEEISVRMQIQLHKYIWGPQRRGV